VSLALERWGGGGAGRPPRATHTYARAGAYTARLTVTDDRGDTTTGAVRVDAR
ncbi:PKD domain-containing protein, partial [Streptomyces sp. NPDC059096]|uniref:PKD domain-containing protein n=1 Tax=Streptomyces sp. NPDC059096 TaxID=3346727 RepID=UPI0036AD70EB